MVGYIRRSLSPEKSTKNGGESDPQDEDELRPSNNLVRYYTCPLDQVRSKDQRKFTQIGFYIVVVM